MSDGKAPKNNTLVELSVQALKGIENDNSFLTTHTGSQSTVTPLKQK
jgi:hypothetical protein